MPGLRPLLCTPPALLVAGLVLALAACHGDQPTPPPAPKASAAPAPAPAAAPEVAAAPANAPAAPPQSVQRQAVRASRSADGALLVIDLLQAQPGGKALRRPVVFVREPKPGAPQAAEDWTVLSSLTAQKPLLAVTEERVGAAEAVSRTRFPGQTLTPAAKDLGRAGALLVGTVRGAAGRQVVGLQRRDCVAGAADGRWDAVTLGGTVRSGPFELAGSRFTATISGDDEAAAPDKLSGGARLGAGCQVTLEVAGAGGGKAPAIELLLRPDLGYGLGFTADGIVFVVLKGAKAPTQAELSGKWRTFALGMGRDMTVAADGTVESAPQPGDPSTVKGRLKVAGEGKLEGTLEIAGGAAPAPPVPGPAGPVAAPAAPR